MLIMRVTAFAAKVRKSMILSSTVYSLFSMCSVYFIISWNLTMMAKLNAKQMILLTISANARTAISSVSFQLLLIVY